MARPCFRAQKWQNGGQCANSSWQMCCWLEHKYTKIVWIFGNVTISLGFIAPLKNQEAWNRRPTFPRGSAWPARSSQCLAMLEAACLPLPLAPAVPIYSSFLAPWASNHRLGDRQQPGNAEWLTAPFPAWSVALALHPFQTIIHIASGATYLRALKSESACVPPDKNSVPPSCLGDRPRVWRSSCVASQARYLR